MSSTRAFFVIVLYCIYSVYVYANECVNVNDARARARECVFAASVVGPRPDAAGAP